MTSHKNTSIDFPAPKFLEAHLKAGAQIVWQDEAWYLFDADGNDLAYGETLSDMLVSLIFREC